MARKWDATSARSARAALIEAPSLSRARTFKLFSLLRMSFAVFRQVHTSALKVGSILGDATPTTMYVLPEMANGCPTTVRSLLKTSVHIAYDKMAVSCCPPEEKSRPVARGNPSKRKESLVTDRTSTRRKWPRRYTEAVSAGSTALTSTRVC